MTIKKVLIANRGEIAVRIIRTLRKMDIKSVAIHSEADSRAMHVMFADESVCVGPANAAESYNNIKNVIAAAEVTGADAIHPGYGFLSESPKFSEMVEQHRLTFLGPTGEQIEQFGSKMTAKNIMESAGIPVVPGSKEAIESFEEAAKMLKTMDFPVLFKGTECGGGRGQRIAFSAEQAEQMFTEAQAEAEAMTKDKRMYVETYLPNPRHIEFQVIGDGKGNVISLGTRDCSVQRRHQKVVEEGPANLDPDLCKEIEQKLCAVLGKYHYRSAGTVEFLESNGKLYFIEVNTRVQVEHPVTEAITGRDIIEMQIRLANGEPLPKQSEIVIKGHAIESRITAESPFEFIPCPGRIDQFLAPGGPGVRVDGALYPGWIIPPWYDSLATKIISWAPSREECIRVHKLALMETTISGIETSLPLQLWILDQPDFVSGNFGTQWLEKALKTR